MKSKKWKINHIPQQVSESAAALNAAWAKPSLKPSRFKTPNLRPMLGGSTGWRLLSNSPIIDLDWYMTGVTDPDQSAVALYTEKNGERLFEACEGATLIHSPRDPITNRILFYMLKWHGEDISMGPPITYHNFSFLVDPENGDIILDDSIPEHEDDISLFFEKNQIKSYHLDTLIRQAYTNPYQINILAWFIKSYHVLIRDFNKSFHPDTAADLHQLFKNHPLIAQAIRERLVNHYLIHLKKFESEAQIDAYLSQLKGMVKTLAGDTDPTPEEIRVAKLEEQHASLLSKLDSARNTVKAYERSAKDIEAVKTKYEEKSKKQEQKSQDLIKENKSQKEALEKLNAELAKKQIPSPPSLPVKQALPNNEMQPAEHLTLLLYHLFSYCEFKEPFVKQSAEQAAKYIKKHFANRTQAIIFQQKAIAALYENVTQHVQISYFYNVFRQILTVSNECPIHIAAMLHLAILNLDATLIDASQNEPATAPPAENRITILERELLRSLLVAKILTTGKSALIDRLESIHKFFAENQKDLATSLSAIDGVVQYFTKNHLLIMNWYKDSNSELIPTIREYRKLIAGMRELDLQHASERYIKFTPGVSREKLFKIMSECDEKYTQDVDFRAWQAIFNHYTVNGEKLVEEKKRDLATLALRGIFLLLRAKNQLNETSKTQLSVDIYHEHFSNLVTQSRRTQQPLLPNNDPLITSMSPLLSIGFHKEARTLDEKDLIEKHTDLVRRTLLPYLRVYNILGLPTERLLDDDALRDEHYQLMRAFSHYCLYMSIPEDYHSSTVIHTLLPAISIMSKTVRLNAYQKDLLYKASLFSTRDKKSATQNNETLNIYNDSMRKLLLMGYQLSGFDDQTILDISNTIYQTFTDKTVFANPSEASSVKLCLLISERSKLYATKHMMSMTASSLIPLKKKS